MVSPVACAAIRGRRCGRKDERRPLHHLRCNVTNVCVAPRGVARLPRIPDITPNLAAMSTPSSPIEDPLKRYRSLQAALDLGQRHGHTRWRAILLDGLCLALEALGRYDEAQASWLEGSGA